MEMSDYPPVSANVRYLTPRELSDLWKHSGLTAEELDNPMASEDPGKALAAIAWIITRRTHPDITLDEAWDVPISLDDAEPDPTNASS